MRNYWPLCLGMGTGEGKEKTCGLDGITIAGHWKKSASKEEQAVRVGGLFGGAKMAVDSSDNVKRTDLKNSVIGRLLASAVTMAVDRPLIPEICLTDY